MTPETTELLNILITAIAGLLTAAITVFGPVLWSYARSRAKQAGVELTDEHRRLVEAYAIDAVRFAEEQARKRWKLGDMMSGDEKLLEARRRFAALCTEDGVRCGGNLDAVLESVVNAEREDNVLVDGDRTVTPAERPSMRGGAR